jgi:hypothetical protein
MASTLFGPIRRGSLPISSERSKPTTALAIGRCSRVHATKGLRPTGHGFRGAFIAALALATCRFEWTFFRLLIELEPEWHGALSEAGEPPLLGRVIGLLAQSSLSTPGKWTAGYRSLKAQPLRPQWRREWLTAPPFTPAFANAKEEFGALLMEHDFAVLEKLLVWFQAQHTVPSPVILQRIDNPVEGIDNVRAADMLGWPSDFQSWGRLLDWLFALAPTLPARLLPHVVEVFGVWQNVFADFQNPRSAAIVENCSNWLIDLEEAEYPERAFERKAKWRELAGEAPSTLATSLRAAVLRSARSYPKPAIALFGRAVANERMRCAAYSDLMAFTPTMADVAPDAVVAVAETELMEELPQERFDRLGREERERREWLKKLRAIPEGIVRLSSASRWSRHSSRSAPTDWTSTISGSTITTITIFLRLRCTSRSRASSLRSQSQRSGSCATFPTVR